MRDLLNLRWQLKPQTIWLFSSICVSRSSTLNSKANPTGYWFPWKFCPPSTKCTPEIGRFRPPFPKPQKPCKIEGFRRRQHFHPFRVLGSHFGRRIRVPWTFLRLETNVCGAGSYVRHLSTLFAKMYNLVKTYQIVLAHKRKPP